jgi:predicted ATPase/DNA-binding SARP family transcriptional activator
VEYGVLGQLRVGGPGHERTPTGQRARDVLAVLLARRDQSVDPLVLLDLVWGEESLPLDVSVVHTVVARLRRTLGSEEIETTGRGYRLRPGSVDETGFADLVEQAQRLRTGNPDRSIELFREGLALWRADRAYADVTDHLVSAEVARLGEWRSSATQGLAELLLEQGHREAVGELIRLTDAFIVREPLHERAHELHMLGLWRAGRQAEALATYERYRVMLRDELGVDPSASTMRLHGQMLTQDPMLDAVSRRASRPSRPAPSAPATPLVGRETELAQVQKQLSERRLVVVTGLGGVGKSRLLSEVHQRLDDGRESAYLDLATLGPVEHSDLVEALGQTLEVRLDTDDSLGSLARSLAPRELVLLIDEAERSIGPVAEVVGELLARCPSLRLLVASRRPLGVVGETIVPLEPLPVPTEGADLDEVSGADAVRLLRARISDHAPTISFGPAELLLLGRLVRRVDGLPLALELLAGYAGTHALSELDELLEDSIDLTSADAGRPERHRTLRDTILWSVERLPPGHRQVLRRLGVFSGSFDLAAARAVVGADCDDVDGTTRALVREGLIQARREDQSLALRLPTAVRDLAATGLAEEGELADARARHRRWHAAERWRGELRSEALLLDMRHHYPDYLAALRSGLEDGDGESVGAVALTLARFWGFTEMISVGERWFDEVVRSGLLSPLHEARIRTMRAHLAVHHDPAGTRADLTAALPVLIAERDAPSLVTAYIISALERFESGELDEAAVAGQRAIEASALAPPERQADAYGMLALVQASTDPVSAAVTAREAWARASGCGNPASRASVATNVSLALMEIGDAAEALALLRRATADMNDDAVPMFLLFNTAWAELLCGDPGAALAGFTQSLQAYEAPADRFAAEAFSGAACALAELRRPEASELLAGATELLARNEQVLQPWQMSRLERARAETSPWTGIAWPDSLTAFGAHLARLVRQADEAPAG